jgi:hypothetical protein
MIEEAAPKYLPLSKCVSREQELMSQRVDKRIVVLEDQKLQVKTLHLTSRQICLQI